MLPLEETEKQSEADNGETSTPKEGFRFKKVLITSDPAKTDYKAIMVYSGPNICKLSMSQTLADESQQRIQDTVVKSVSRLMSPLFVAIPIFVSATNLVGMYKHLQYYKLMGRTWGGLFFLVVGFKLALSANFAYFSVLRKNLALRKVMGQTEVNRIFTAKL